ncbi:SGNH/GDSL hydrolase family protein [Legionella dresdenensis]|uniref:SGNH/GDSL hydrolase family protein n=1 Tax=Legionella dresdenensis TaxID=450200 RepID=A0ABV8CCZ0_9GAMM
MKPQISRFIFMGDSLSDRGTLAKRYILGCIPMDKLAGLRGYSPLGRFTNGLAWSDHIAATIINKFIIEDAHARGLTDCCDIADAVINDDQRIRKLRKFSYSLDDNLYVKYKDRDFVRNYNQGGLTAHDYSWLPSTSVTRFFTRLIVATLEEMRQQLFAYDRAQKISKEYKAETLVIEWSGANDLITVNDHPSKRVVDKAIAARRENMEQLVKHDYRHFVLFNLPDLSLAPRYQALSETERANAHRWSMYFNQQLQALLEDLTIMYPHCSFHLFDVCTLFTEIYNNPERYGFERAKLTVPYKGSADFHINPDSTSAASGYMFWDDVHPAADGHSLLAAGFYDLLELLYNFSTPAPQPAPLLPLVISEDKLNNAYVRRYQDKVGQSPHGFFSKTRARTPRRTPQDEPLMVMHNILTESDSREQSETDLQLLDDCLVKARQGRAPNMA